MGLTLKFGNLSISSTWLEAGMRQSWCKCVQFWSEPSPLEPLFRRLTKIRDKNATPVDKCRYKPTMLILLNLRRKCWNLPPTICSNKHSSARLITTQFSSNKHTAAQRSTISGAPDDYGAESVL